MCVFSTLLDYKKLIYTLLFEFSMIREDFKYAKGIITFDFGKHSDSGTSADRAPYKNL